MPPDPRRIEVIDDATAAMFRAMSPEKRIVMGLSMGESARRLMAAGIRSSHPDWPESRIREEVARRFLRDQ